MYEILESPVKRDVKQFYEVKNSDIQGSQELRFF